MGGGYFDQRGASLPGLEKKDCHEKSPMHGKS